MLKRVIILLCLMVGVLACSSSESVTPLPEKSHPVADSQNKRPPVFYPVRSVRSASPGLSEYPTKTSKAIILKKFYFDFPDSTLCEVGQGLANAFNYKFYCASSLEERKYAVTKLLSPYELKDLIEQENNVKVTIDTIHKEVRLLAGSQIAPKFAN